MNCETKLYLVVVMVVVVIIAGCAIKPEVTIEAKRTWALGASAVLMERNHARHDLLSGNEINERNIRVTKKGGKVLFSSYSEKIWEDRLEWFYDQYEQGLVGEIDEDKTADGTIVCKDGFKATTFSKEEFQNIVQKMNLKAEVKEVDDSSIFCIIIVKM